MKKTRAFARVALLGIAAICQLPGQGLATVLADRLVRDECYWNGDDPLSAPPMPPSPDMVTRLIAWIGDATSYDITGSLQIPPEIRFCVHGEEIPYEGNSIIVPEDLRAAYDWPNRQVYLVRPWSAERLLDRGALLHELVHHVQLQNRRYECPQASEWEAYKLQEAWLAEQGVEAGFDWLQIYLGSRCPRDHHP